MPIKSLAELEASLSATEPPAGLDPPLQALWHEAKGDWDRAHGIVQDDPSAEGAWVHAYLHRAEADLSNAGYWYRRAGRPASKAPLREEWRAIVETLLGG
jgi:hypothetical protein